MTDENADIDFEGFIKGDLAESIVCYLFRALGFHIQYTGVEVTSPNLLLLTHKQLIDRATVKKQFAQADLLIIKEQDEIHPNGFSREIEVKYRREGEIRMNKLTKFSDDVHFIFVDKKDFWSISKIQLMERKKKSDLEFASLTLLENDETFHFSEKDKAIINMFKSYTGVIDHITISPNPLKSA